VDTPKNAPVTHTNYRDPCFSIGSRNEQHLVFAASMQEWKALVLAGANASEVAAMATMEGNKWRHSLLPDAGRAEVPLSKGEDVFPAGAALVTCTEETVQKSADR